jgi:hypothetical protein
MAVTVSEWLARYATLLGVPPPKKEEIETLLALTGVAAHAAERTAAPLSAWMVGCAGCDVAKAHQAAQQLAAELECEVPTTIPSAPNGG